MNSTPYVQKNLRSFVGNNRYFNLPTVFKKIDTAQKYNFYSYRQLKERDFDQRVDSIVGQKISSEYVFSDLKGDPVKLSELLASGPLLIEFGSKSCPIFRGIENSMDSVWNDYKGQAQVVLLYTREAHPGFFSAEHNSFEQKLRAAKKLETAGVKRRILVDSIEGSFHDVMGAFPNGGLIIAKDGVVTHHSPWTQPEKMRVYLDELLMAGGLGKNMSEFTANACPMPKHLDRAQMLKMMLAISWVGGPDALLDFVGNHLLKKRAPEVSSRMKAVCDRGEYKITRRRAY